MPLTLKGITPNLLIDTRDIQNSTPTVGSKFNKTSGEMSTRAIGICASLVSFWLSHEADGTPVRRIDEFPSGFQLSIAQGSYAMDPRGGGVDKETLLDRFGNQVVSSKAGKSKWYNMKGTKVEEAIGQTVKMNGFYYLSISGDGGGHALGFSTKHYAQFFDPNIGVLEFKSLSDLRNWVPALISRYYSDLMKETKLYGVG